MAPAPSTSSSSSSSYCPYDWRVKVKDYVDIELTQDNYPDWKQAMLDFIEMQGMEGFLINPPPPQKIPAPTPATINDQGEEVQSDGALTSEDEIDDGPDLKAWKRSDRLLHRWILATLSPSLGKLVAQCETAGDLWQKLKDNYNQRRLKDKKAKELEPYLPLLRATMKGNWEAAHIILRTKPQFKTAQITTISETALMVALKLSRRDKFVRTMVGKMSPDEVLQTNSGGVTALHLAAATGNLEAVKLLESKNEGLLNICCKEGRPPLYFAAFSGKRQVVDYLFPVTPEDSCKGNVGNKVAEYLIVAGFYDVALNWIRRSPELECDFDKLLETLAMKSSSFESGMELNFWQSLIYRFIKTNQKKRGDIESVADHHVSGCHTKWGKLYAVLWKVTAGRLSKILEHVKEKKVMNHHAKDLLQLLCSKIVDLEPEKIKVVLENSIEKAICNGMEEIVEEILASYPEALFLGYGKIRHTLFHRAVIHRCEKVFDCLICKIGEGKQIMLRLKDEEGNSVLHLAANLTSEQLTKLKQEVATPALQMQRELQWFKEVLKLSSPNHREDMNYQQKTAAQVFTESHKELLKEGETWMKETANSCSVVAALIVTIVFAAAITVPGGNNSENGNPILFDDLAFKIFAISDGFAFFSSSFSVFIFLSILTARFAEEDFLKSLPRRLIFGFISLFLSIIAMMVAFIVTVYLFLGHKKVWILTPVTALGLLSVASFAFLQFPLLWKMFKYTFFPLHFPRKNKAKCFGMC